MACRIAHDLYPGKCAGRRRPDTACRRLTAHGSEADRCGQYSQLQLRSDRRSFQLGATTAWHFRDPGPQDLDRHRHGALHAGDAARYTLYPALSLASLLFTYLIPLVPLTCLWDGSVSQLRAYTPQELAGLAASLGDVGSQWSAGKVRASGTSAPLTHRIGVPEPLQTS